MVSQETAEFRQILTDWSNSNKGIIAASHVMEALDNLRDRVTDPALRTRITAAINAIDAQFTDDGTDDPLNPEDV